MGNGEWRGAWAQGLRDTGSLSSGEPGAAQEVHSPWERPGGGTVGEAGSGQFRGAARTGRRAV